GDEAGIEGFGDPFCRATYPWGAENEDLLEFYRGLGAVRRSSSAFKDGGFIPFCADGDLFAFIRKSGETCAFIAVNRGEESKSISLPDEFIKSKRVFGVKADSGALTLPPFGYSVISQE
ncbi:MAG: glycoside hydrolase family 13 protein, partial [Clostridia bacterium]|nr:glycoside hydrolase family 13 protein [Clostridia bacterium]